VNLSAKLGGLLVDQPQRAAIGLLQCGGPEHQNVKPRYAFPPARNGFDAGPALCPACHSCKASLVGGMQIRKLTAVRLSGDASVPLLSYR
jgi:hypothetical protein